MEKKKKREPSAPQDKAGALFTLFPPVEFLAPLALEECVRRLEVKGRSTPQLQVQMRQQTPGHYRFDLVRYERSNEWRTRQKISATLRGELRYWDDESTLVNYRGRLDFHPMRLLLPLLITAVIFVFIEPAIALTAVVVGLVLLGYAFMDATTDSDQKRLERLVHDSLRDPILP